MKGKHSKRPGPFGLSPRANGALIGLAVFGVAATTVQAAKSPEETGTSVTAVHTVPKPRAADPSESRKSDKPDSAKSDPDERSQVISRAKTWNPHSDQRVRYSQSDYHEGYRTDCSGFVAMTLGLPKPGPNTVGLTSSRFTERISMSELKKGDLVMDAEGTNTTRHVVIFEKWANSRHTSYWAYEQRGRYGTDYRTRDYGLSSGSEYKAYRPVKLSDA
ncbi:hypothetical protein ABZ806_31910 [Spirillospora sp. NPDC047418]